MRKIFSEASLAAVNPGNQSAIDINMIDGAGGFTPAHMALEAPPAGGGPDERPLLSSTTMQNVHAIESMGADKLLLDGQFHQTRAERDHMSIANPRSLIFDTPSIFSHRHLSSKPVGQQADERPMIETLATEGKEDGKGEKKEAGVAGKAAKAGKKEKTGGTEKKAEAGGKDH
jgi:hypothetical protein